MTQRRRWMRWGILLAAVALVAGGIVWLRRPPSVPARSWLIVRLDGDLFDEKGAGTWGKTDASGFLQLRRAVGAARVDGRVRGVLFLVGDGGVPRERVGDMVDICRDLKDAHKEVCVHASTLGLGTWTFARHADVLALHPRGTLDLRAPRLSLPFFAQAFERAALSPDLVFSGDEQWIREQLTRDEPSTELRARATALQERWWELARRTSDAPRKDAEACARLAAAGPLSAERALEEQWIDQIAYERDFLDERGGARIDLGQYKDVPVEAAGLNEDAAIGVIFIRGLLWGEESRDLAAFGRTQGLADVRKALAEIRASRAVRGVIVFIESPGGEMYAADELWRELDRMQTDSGIHMVALLGAEASGGAYYAALSCKHIYACPETITGSIGGVSGRVLTRGWLDKWGVTPCVIGAESGSLPSPWQKYQEGERAIVTESLRRAVDVFVERVSRERRLDAIRALEAAAGGRVYLGEEALRLNLVDGIGGWREAWDRVCRLAEIEYPETVSLEVFPRPTDWWEHVLEGELPAPALPGIEPLLAALGEHTWFLGPIVVWQ